jgi:hypothetical protein
MMMRPAGVRRTWMEREMFLCCDSTSTGPRLPPLDLVLFLRLYLVWGFRHIQQFMWRRTDHGIFLHLSVTE